MDLTSDKIQNEFLKNWIFLDWGLIEFSEALKGQLAVVEKILRKETSDTIVFCTHSPLVTLGRATRNGDNFAWTGPMLEVSRGGRATYHGPSQLVIYVMSDLSKSKNIGGLMRMLENVVVECLLTYGISARGKLAKSGRSIPEQNSLEDTGVWVGDKKIASLGISVKNWISYHGIAINLDHDENAFKGIRPCGYDSEVMTSLEKIVGQKTNRNQFVARLKGLLLSP